MEIGVGLDVVKFAGLQHADRRCLQYRLNRHRETAWYTHFQRQFHQYFVHIFVVYSERVTIQTVVGKAHPAIQANGGLIVSSDAKRQFFDFAFGQRNDRPNELKAHAMAPLISDDIHPPQSPAMTHLDRARYEQASDTGKAGPNVTPHNQATREGVLEPNVGPLCLFLVRRAKCVRVLL